MAKLLVYRGSTLDRQLDLAEREYRIGRGDQNDIVLEDATKAVSRLHAELRYEGGRFVVTDLNSQNGIWLEGKKVPRAVLEPGVPVTMGPYRLVLEPPAAARVATPAPSPPPPEPPAPRVEPVAPPKPVARRPVRKGGSRGRTILLFGSLFLVLVVAGVAIGLFWPSGGPGEPVAVEPQAQPPAAPPGTETQPAAASGSAGQAAAPTEPPAADTTPLSTAASPTSGSGGQPAGRRRTTTAPEPPADPSVPARRPGENVNAWRSRTRQVQTLYKQGATALTGGDFVTAISRFEAILQEAPDYLDVPALLQDARENLRRAARTIFDEGVGLEKAGDLPGALQTIERAVALDPSIEGADQATARIRSRMLAEGEDAFKRARQYDALGRSADAIAQYGKALQLLPADHESRQVAAERLKALKGGIK